jgi:hypothetical protein
MISQWFTHFFNPDSFSKSGEHFMIFPEHNRKLSLVMTQSDFRVNAFGTMEGVKTAIGLNIVLHYVTEMDTMKAPGILFANSAYN